MTFNQAAGTYDAAQSLLGLQLANSDDSSTDDESSVGIGGVNRHNKMPSTVLLVPTLPVPPSLSTILRKVRSIINVSFRLIADFTDHISAAGQFLKVFKEVLVC